VALGCGGSSSNKIDAAHGTDAIQVATDAHGADAIAPADGAGSQME